MSIMCDEEPLSGVVSEQLVKIEMGCWIIRPFSVCSRSASLNGLSQEFRCPKNTIYF